MNTTFNVIHPKGRGTLKVSSTPLGRGGEGEVFSVESHTCDFLPNASDLVVKTYYDPEDNNRQDKITAMIQATPDSDSVAWPIALAGQNNNFQGYLMKKLDTKNQKEWLYLSNSKERKTHAPDFNVQYSLNTCLNLAIAIHSVHQAGHILGDINESNAFVGSDSSVTIVDTDSAQIKSKDGFVFVCSVGKQEFLAPELIGHNLRDVERNESTDAFAFAIMMFAIITGGAHPTDGRYINDGDPASIASRISQNIYPALRNEIQKGYAPVQRVASVGVPTRLNQLMIEILVNGPESRPNFENIIEVLKDVMSNITQCTEEKNHFYDKRDNECGFCVHVDNGQIDPWGDKPKKSNLTQTALPPLSFQNEQPISNVAPRTSINAPVSSYNPPIQSYASQSPMNTYTAPSSPTSANQPQSHVQSSPQVQPQLSNIPEKIGWRITVVYPDGSYSARPSYKRLANGNPKLLFQALIAECPSFLKFWWRRDQDAPDLGGIFIGFLVSIVLFFVLGFSSLSVISTYVPNDGFPWRSIGYGAWLFGLAAIIFTNLFLFFNSFVKRVKIDKSEGLDNSNTMTRIGTVMKFAIITFTHLFAVLILLFAVLRILSDNQR